LEVADYLADETPEEESAEVLLGDGVADPIISLHTISGIHTEDMMQVHIDIRGHRLLALLDSCSTDNFNKMGVKRRIRLEPVGTAMRVAVTNGNRIHCDGVAHNMAMRINQEDFSISCFGIDMRGFNLILGVDYLHTLGPIVWDFEDLSVSFWWGARRVSLKGEGATRRIAQ
jgi:hypothetical protein